MNRFFALVTVVALGCGGSSSGTDPDGGNGDGDGGNGDGDGGGQPGAKTVKLTLTGFPTNPAKFNFLVAYQDGAGAWQLAPAPVGETYSFTINAPVYGVAYACSGAAPGNGGTTTVRSVTSAHFAVAERTELTLEVPARCTDRTGDTAMLAGQVTNRPIGGLIALQYGNRSVFAGTQNGNFSFQVPTGTHDLLVAHVIPEGNGDFYIDEVVVQRNLAVNGNTQKAIDFATAESTTYLNVDASAAPFNARVVANTTLYTANGTTATLVREAQNWESDALADSQQLATDLYEQSISVSQLGSSATIAHVTNQPGEQTWEAPDELGDVMTTVPTKQPYITLQTTWPAYADAIGYLWNASQQGSCSGSSVCTTTWSAYLSPGVTGANPGYRMPDLSGLTGWSDIYELGSSPIAGSVTATTSTAGAGDFPTAKIADGIDRVSVRSDYGVQP